MLIRVPDYYEAFRCLAGACPHSCCGDWEVEVDAAAAAFYRAVPGGFGAKLRENLAEEDGETTFRLTPEGRCPFLDGENLCEIHKTLGEAATSVVCQAHPRFTEDYGPLREITLSASCPAARDLLLGSEAPLQFETCRTDGPEEAGDEWLPLLEAVRETAFSILRDRSRPLRDRLAELLLLADGAQALLDGDRAAALPAFCADWTAPALPALPAGPGLFPAGWETLKSLEILGADWRAALDRLPAASAVSVPEWALERIAAYFLFRHALKAVNDGDLLGRVELAVFAALAVAGAAAVLGLPEALRLYCREIEHDGDNVDALLERFRTEPALALPAFLRELKKL